MIGANLAARARKAGGFMFRAVAADGAYEDQDGFRAVAADGAYEDRDGFRAELSEAGLAFVMALKPRRGTLGLRPGPRTPR